MGIDDDDNGAEVRELRALLRSAQNDVKRYAAHVVRLQQELDRERIAAQRRQETDAPDELPFVGEELRDQEVANVTSRAEGLQQSLEMLLQDVTRDGDVCHCRRNHSTSATLEDVDETRLLQTVKSVVETQKRQIEQLARENAQLRDMLAKRPTHRDLARSQWQVERLQLQVDRMREENRSITQEDLAGVPVFDQAPEQTLTDRISVDKLLSWLHVETKKVKHPSGVQTKSNRRRFLKEPVACYLVLDAAALDGPTTSSSSTLLTENEKMKKREQLSRRVGILCSEIVASCCHSVGVYSIAKLPRYVEAAYQHAQLVPYLQDFVHEVDNFTRAAELGIHAMRDETRAPKTVVDKRFLESLATRIQDLVFEVRARREQMKPPGDHALDVVLRCMKLLRADRIAELAPTIDRLLETTRSEKEFVRDVRMVLGLDITAPKATVLSLVRRLVEQVGLTAPSTTTAKERKSSHVHSRLTNSSSGRGRA